MTDKVKDKLQARAKRFNIVSAEEKARAREAKFGTASNNIGQSDPAKSSDRSKRFGPLKSDISKSESEKLKQRIRRFSSTTDSAEKLAKRAERFSK